MRALFIVAAIGLGHSPARADEPRSLPRERVDVEGPPPSPGLSHRGIAVDLDYTVASAQPTDIATSAPVEGARAYAYAARLAIEADLHERRWYLGLANELAAARVPGATQPTGFAAVVGNPEVWARGLWMSHVGLSAGGGLGLVLPLPRGYSGVASEVVRAVRVIRPWDEPHFEDRTLTARPFLDVRHVLGPAVFQLRQGVDVLLRARDPGPGENRVDLAALASVYAGLRLLPPATLGVELFEVYQLSEDTSSPSCVAPCDQHRVQFTLAPSLRLSFRHVSPSLSLLLPLSTPLRADVASYLAARFHLGAIVDLP